MNETWLAVPGAPYYEVSDIGRVRSLDRVVVGKNGIDYPHKGKVLAQTIGSNGYPMVTISYATAKSRYRTVHTLVAEAFLGERPEGAEVLHGNGVATDSRLSNLRYGTPLENRADSISHGTDVRLQNGKCKRGHAMTAGNLYLTTIQGRGSRRQCRECTLLTTKEAQRVRRGYYSRHPDATHLV